MIFLKVAGAVWLLYGCATINAWKKHRVSQYFIGWLYWSYWLTFLACGFIAGFMS